MKQSLGVPDKTRWKMCNVRVDLSFVESGDFLVTTDGLVEKLLQRNVAVLAYSGEPPSVEAISESQQDLDNAPNQQQIQPVPFDFLSTAAQGGRGRLRELRTRTLWLTGLGPRVGCRDCLGLSAIGARKTRISRLAGGLVEGCALLPG